MAMKPTPRGSTGHGCYICRPEDPLAEEEGCSDCDREFFENPEMGVGMNWLVTRLLREGLDRMDLSSFTLVRR